MTSSIYDFDTIVKDPFSINVLVRGAIENYLVLNYTSNRFEEEDLLFGRFDIWMRYGLTKRGITPETEEENKISRMR